LGSYYIGRTARIPLAQEDEFEIELQGDFTPGSPEPDFHEAWPLKHVYINQSRRRRYLNALVARCNGASWYAHDIRIIGNSEIVYDRRGGGFRDNVQLWIQTRGKVVNLVDPWEMPVQKRVNPVSPDILGKMVDERPSEGS
jgi:hypothetical protein